MLKSKTPTPEGDIYSVGLVLFELLTGTPPFTAEAVAALFAQHLTKPVPQLTDYRSDVPTWCQELIEICAEKNPADRFGSMSELLGELFSQSTRSGIDLAASGIPQSVLDLAKASCKRRRFFGRGS
jgi:serine/threonine protein kinase